MAAPEERERAVALAAGLSELARVFVSLHPREVSLTAESVLIALDGRGPLRIAQLVVEAGVSQPSMTELVARLERDGQVGRQRDPADRRAVLVSLTSDGRAGLRGRRAETSRRLAVLLGELSSADLAALEAALPAFMRLRDAANPPNGVATC